MKWKNWMKLYEEIERDFKFRREKEIESRNTLSKILGDKVLSIEDIGNLIGEEVYVVGFSPSLENEIELIPDRATIIAADDAAVILNDLGIKPTIVMSDLDGDIDSLIRIKSSVFGIHAHGDNIPLLPYAEFFPKKFGTTQIEPLENVYNFGGFTDGDRCVFLAAHFDAKIHILGFDFENPRIKEGKDMIRKRKKLRWAKYLIHYLEQSGAKIIWENLNSK